MSMSRAAAQEICDFLQQKPSSILGTKFFDSRCALPVEAAFKADKFDSRIFVISKFRAFIISGKTTASLKIEKSFHVLSIKSIHVAKEDELIVSFEENVHKKKLSMKSSHGALFLARHLLSAIKHYFPDIGPQLPSIIDIVPASLYADFSSLQIDVSPRPCNSFRRSYAALCDFYEQPYREEVSWDVEKIYTVNRLRDLRIDDFSHLLPRDLLPIVGVLQYSSYFSGLVADGVRVPPDVIDVVLSVIRKSQNLRKLQLRNCALPKDFIILLASAIQNNPISSLEYLDISKNVLDDKKGFSVLCTVLPRMTSLRYLNVAECQLSEKCVNLLCSGIYNGVTSCKNGSVQLTELNLSSNLLKEDVSSLVNLISLCVSLRVLDLSDTGFPLEKIWPALKYGGLQIEKLFLGGCNVGKKGQEGVQTVKEYFSMCVNLSHLSFNNTTLSADFVKALLLGLASNQQLKPIRLDLDATCEKSTASVFEMCLSGVRCESLSIRDNHLEADLQGILQSLGSMNCLKHLDIGGTNFLALKRSSKQTHAAAINKILLDIVKLYSDESCLEELIISDSRLGAHLSVLLNTLGATNSLRTLDISSNEMGNFGARILSKALQVNVSLRTLYIDNNHIGADGFVDLANALKMNQTLTNVPYPVHDAFECLQRAERPRAVAALAQLQNALYRNRTSSSFDDASAKRIFYSSVYHQLEKSSDDANQTQELVAGFAGEGFPVRLKEMIEDFTEQIRREGALVIGESLSKIGGNGETSRAEQMAASRLCELWTEQAKSVFSEWRWKELCDRVEISLQSPDNVSSRNESSANLSPFTPTRSQGAHRPRSIVGEFFSFEGDGGINMDVPPKPSALQHLQKGRPRRRGAGSSKPAALAEDVMLTSRSTETDEEEDAKSAGEIGQCESPEHSPRVAMVPDPLLLAQARTTTPFKESTTPCSSSSSPPPLPQRNRTMGVPPLPPKPEPRVRTLIPAPEDDENANSRRSVADMARIFNK